MNLSIHQEISKKDLFAFLAKEFFRLFDETLTHKPIFDVALFGGTTAQEYLTDFIAAASIHNNLHKIRFFFSDERAVPKSSEFSNAGNAMRILMRHLPLTDDQFFPMFDESLGVAVSALSYEEHLRKTLIKNHQGLPCFDLIYLGIGNDGHTASLFPGSSLLRNIEYEERLVREAKENNIVHERITFMPKLLNAAKSIHVVATGSQKAKVIDDILNGPLQETTLPAQLVLRNPKTDVTLFVAEMNGNLSLKQNGSTPRSTPT